VSLGLCPLDEGRLDLQLVAGAEPTSAAPALPAAQPGTHTPTCGEHDDFLVCVWHLARLLLDRNGGREQNRCLT
jgi:hypothetical protein